MTTLKRLHVQGNAWLTQGSRNQLPDMTTALNHCNTPDHQERFKENSVNRQIGATTRCDFFLLKEYRLKPRVCLPSRRFPHSSPLVCPSLVSTIHTGNGRFQPGSVLLYREVRERATDGGSRGSVGETWCLWHPVARPALWAVDKEPATTET